MTEALASRDIGGVIRIFRRWTGASQTDIGMLVGIPQSHVSELERGVRRVAALDLFERFADGLNIPRVLLGLADRSESTMPGASPGPGERSRHDWLDVRRFLSAHRTELTRLASGLYPESIRLDDTGILSPPGWTLDVPIDLTRVKLRWQSDAPGPKITGAERETRRLRPVAASSREYGRYHRAVRDLNRPRLFENRLCYRLLDVATGERDDAGGPTIDLTLGDMCYFDMIDAGEALAHEIALVARTRPDRVDPRQVSWDNLQFRRLMQKPFDLAAYPLLLSISTLTIRRSKAASTFFMLRRDPAKVAIAGGMLSVFPTGVFQPASVMPAPESPDFDLWRNVMREYSEEFLGNPEHDGDGPPVDYTRDEPFRSLEAARRAGKIRVLCLGVGIDALNYVGDVFTVAVFEADTFDRIFDGMVESNDEGQVDAEEFAFDEESIDHLLAREPLAPSGAACLYLARRHSRAILPATESRSTHQ